MSLIKQSYESSFWWKNELTFLTFSFLTYHDWIIVVRDWYFFYWILLLLSRVTGLKKTCCRIYQSRRPFSKTALTISCIQLCQNNKILLCFNTSPLKGDNPPPKVAMFNIIGELIVRRSTYGGWQISWLVDSIAEGSRFNSVCE